MENLDSINKQVVQKIVERAALGKTTYGVTMDRDDLKLQHWLAHLQEELLDAAVYIEKILKQDQSKSTTDRELSDVIRA